MRVLLVDDVQLILDVFESMLKKFDGVEIVGKYTDPRRVLEDINKLQVDAIFLDMEMGDVHGLELAEAIMMHYSHIQIIFVTSHPQFALEAFEVNAIDYIVKPIKAERLGKAIEKIRERLVKYNQQSAREETTLFANALGSFRLINAEQKVVKWRTRKVQELFVYLWHHRKNPVHKARIIEDLWPDMDALKAVQLLHTTIYQLRKTLKDAGADKAIKFVNDHYLLMKEIHSDVEELETIISSREIEPEKVDKVLELYKDDYLAEDDYRWALQAQQELKQAVLYYLENYIVQHSKNESSFLVQRCLEKMVGLDCYNEEYLFKLLDYYGKTKNFEQFISLYKTIKKLFEDELEVETPEKIQQMYAYYIKQTIL